MKDSHVHSIISHDGISSISQYITKASQIGVDEITFTEHYDNYSSIITKLKSLDISEYNQKFIEEKDKTDFCINFGLEVGLQPDIVSDIEHLLNQYNFDFIIGSSHITGKKDISMDKSFFEDLNRNEAYIKYFKEVLENIKLYNNFDVYGHLDYIVRYGGYIDNKIIYNDFKDLLDEILLSLIKKEKGIEINTSGFRYNIGSFHPNKEIIKRFIELGGSIITIGSDAHKIDDLARDFKIVYEALEELKVKKIAYYRNRKPYFIKMKH